jgi:hypothetical protein
MNEPLQRMPCGCTYRGEQWVKMCPPCEAEATEHHQRALAEHRRAQELAELLA